MTLEQTYYITEILVGIGFIVSIVFFWRYRCGKTRTYFVNKWPINGYSELIG